MSVYLDIMTAVQNRVAAAAPGVPCYLRRRPQMIANDPLPCIVVAPSPNGEDADMETFSRGITWAYPVHVIVFTRGNRELTIAPTDMDQRENIRNAIFQPLLTGASTVYDLDLQLSGPFNLRAPENTTEVDAFEVIYKSSETRTA